MCTGYVFIPCAGQEYELIPQTVTLPHPCTFIAIRAGRLGSLSVKQLSRALDSPLSLASTSPALGIPFWLVTNSHDSYKMEVEEGKNGIPEDPPLGSSLLG